MGKLLKYDFIYLKKTSKFIIFPAVAIIFAILSPLTARYMNELLKFLMTESGPIISLPDPTVLDSYIQYIGNLYEIFLIVIIFIGVGMFMRDKNKGLLPLILSKPIHRVKYLLSKLTSLSILLLGTLVISGVIFSYYTYFLFEEVDLLIVLNTTLLYFLYILFILSVAMFLSVFTKSYASASILTFIIYIVTNIIGGFQKWGLDYLPGRISQRISEVVIGVVDPQTMIITILVTIVLSGLLLFFSIKKFNQYDI